jgi:CHASE3 domain sensor protein
MDKIYLTQEEKQELETLQSEEIQLVNKIGEISLNIKLLEDQKEENIQKAITLNDTKTQIAKRLQTKYGEGSINLETGEFIKNV